MGNDVSWVRIAVNVCALSCGVVLGFAVLDVAGLVELGDSWPAWVQAVGSIIAIGVAIAIPAEEAARRKAADLAANEARIARAAAILHPALSELSRLLLNFMEAFGPDSPQDEQLNFFAVDSDFEALTPTLVTIITANENLGDLGPDLYKLTILLSSYDAWIKRIGDVITVGYNNHMLRTEMPARLERAEEMFRLTEVILERIVTRYSSSSVH